jgi:hypothetical protein
MYAVRDNDGGLAGEVRECHPPGKVTQTFREEMKKIISSCLRMGNISKIILMSSWKKRH